MLPPKNFTDIAKPPPSGRPAAASLSLRRHVGPYVWT